MERNEKEEEEEETVYRKYGKQTLTSRLNEISDQAKSCVTIANVKREK